MLYKAEYVSHIQNSQFERSADYQLMFCPAVYEIDFVCGNLTEKHLAIKFINYPGSVVKKKHFRKTVTALAELLAKAVSQNRILVEYSDQNTLLEFTDGYDKKNGRKKEN
jgi:hypothetical protein